ncbi:MAG: hypothetical protein ACI9BD_000842 [Candidatus Marinamargulisbacteria bacterium]|jgi:hypothetical protein
MGLREELENLSPEHRKVLINRLHGKPRPHKVVVPSKKKSVDFSERIESGENAFNVSSVLKIEGALDVGILKASFLKLIDRHRVLRSVVNESGGKDSEGMSIVPVEVVSLADITKADRYQAALRRADDEIEKPLDPQGAILMKTILFELSPDRHLMVIILHNMISDGWSLGVLVKELGVLYEAISINKPIDLPKLPIQYTDFVMWQRRWLKGMDFKKNLKFWKKELAGPLPVLTFGGKKKEGASPGERGSFQWALQNGEAIKAFAMAHRVTVFTTLLSAFQIVLSTMYNEDEVLIGCPSSSRHQKDLERVVGFFVNTLVLRSSIAKADTFSSYLDQSSRKVLQAYKHQHLPYTELKHLFRETGAAASQNLFQVMFAVHNVFVPRFKISNLSIELVRLFWGASEVDLILEVWDFEEALVCHFTYNKDCFDESKIADFASRIDYFLSLILHNAEGRLSDLKSRVRAHNPTPSISSSWGHKGDSWGDDRGQERGGFFNFPTMRY